MIQKETYLNVIDNSGAKIFNCIHLGKGYRRRYGNIGDCILGSIKTLRTKRRLTVKIQKGSISTALIVRSKKYNCSGIHDKLKYLDNAIVLLTKQNKLLGTRIFGALPGLFRYTRFFKLIFLATGITK